MKDKFSFSEGLNFCFFKERGKSQKEQKGKDKVRKEVRKERSLILFTLNRGKNCYLKII